MTTIAIVVAAHVAVAFAALTMTGTVTVEDIQPDLQIFDVTEPPPPPPIIEEQPKPKPKPKNEEGKASPENIKSKATPVVAPKPRVVIPVKPPVVVSPTPGQGAQPTQGASDRPGPGTGAGGTGNGTGSGGAGSGDGGGGEGSRPRLVSRSLTQRDYPSQLRQIWPVGGRVLVIFDVQLNGRATGCKVHTSSGNPTIDQVTCSLVESKLRFAPARRTNGEAYVSKYGYSQAPVNF